MKFNRQGFIAAARQEGYSDEDIDRALQSAGEKPIGTLQKIVESPALPIAGGVIGGVAIGLPSGGLLAGPGAGAGALGGSVIQDQLLQLMGAKNGTPSERLAGGMNNATTAFSLGELIGLANYLKPKNVWNRVETKVSQADKSGKTPSASLEREFGTSKQPNPDLYRGLSNAQNSAELRKVTGNEIVGQGRANTNILGPTYSDVLNNRMGAYKSGYDKTVPKSLQDLNKNFGRSYSNVLHSDIPGLKLDDWIYGTEKKIGDVAKTTGKIAAYGGIGSGAAYIVGKILGLFQ